MSEAQKPSVGRVVHYVSRGDQKHLAGTIAWVNDDGTVNLGILDPTGQAHDRADVPYDAAGGPGTWHWPERV